MNKIVMLLMGLFLISLVSANLPHKQNTDLEFSITSNFATECKLTTINSLSNVITINQIGDKDSQTFKFSIDGNNFTNLGTYCMNIECSDSTKTTSGNECRDITPSGNSGNDNLVFFIFIIVMFYAINLIGFFGKNIPMTILGGMAMMFLGVYLVVNGVIIFRDNITLYFSYLTIGIGFLTSCIALFEQLDVI